jgi:hypothetical protein
LRNLNETVSKQRLWLEGNLVSFLYPNKYDYHKIQKPVMRTSSLYSLPIPHHSPPLIHPLTPEIPPLHFFPPPPSIPPLRLSVHPFCACSLSNGPVSPRSALFTPSLLIPSPTGAKRPPLANWPPTPSATPSWMALTFLSPVTWVPSLSRWALDGGF